MSNILIHMLTEPHSEYDIFSKTDYREMSDTFRQRKITCPNLGNRLWFQGLISEISESENTLTYFREDMSKDYINDAFDIIIAPMANVFHKAFSELLQRLAERFRGIRIPVYVIACGVQATSYDDLNELCSAIGPYAREFMKSVYNTGGEFALRGYFTKEFFNRMGFPTAVVTGCPSIYQLGRDLQISDEKVAEDRFRPLVNGKTTPYIAMASRYSGSAFFDQENFFHILHDPNYPLSIHSLIHQYGFDAVKWILSENIKMIPHMNDWWNYLQDTGYHFAYGSRIHGSIMPILAGIPAAIEPPDARTREMAEFFEIPIIKHEKKSLYEIYSETDYSDFNKHFAAKYDVYEQFLVSRGIVKKCNSDNRFFHRCDVNITAWNHDMLEELNRKFLRQKWLWKEYDTILRWKRRGFRKV